MASVSVRYIVNDVEAAVSFYTKHLGFSVEMKPAPGFAMLSRGDLRLLLSSPGGGGGAGQAMLVKLFQPHVDSGRSRSS